MIHLVKPDGSMPWVISCKLVKVKANVVTVEADMDELSFDLLYWPASSTWTKGPHHVEEFERWEVVL